MSKFDEINAGTYYMNIAVFQRTERVRPEAAAEAIAAVEKACEGKDFTIRGFYDLAAFRAEADLMVWWWGSSSDTLQDAYLAFRATELGETLVPVWSQMAIHREAEFNKAHVPNFLQGEKAEDYLCVYPFVRDSEWYLMPEYQRRGMLRQHGQMASEYRDVRANTIASFALGDYEWILAFEAPELHRIVDLMRELRAADARKHMREEQPFFTGRRRELEEIVRSWGPVREGLEMAGGCTCC